MKRKLLTFLKWKPGNKLIAILATGALLLMLLPLLRLCAYAIPWYDDYEYATYVKANYAQSCTLWDALRGAVDAAVDQWHNWEGTFTSNFLATLVPLIWGEDKYFLGPAFLILFLTVSVMILVKVFTRDILRGDMWPSLALQAGSAGMILMLIYSAQQGFYWYDGGAFYVALSSLCLLFTATLLKLVTAQTKPAAAVWMVLGLLCAVATGGGNYVTTLQGLLIVYTFLAWTIWKKREILPWLLPVTAVYTISFLMVVLAPGNSQRATYYVGWGMSPVQAILHSFLEAGRRLPELSGWITVVILIMFAPVMWQIVKKTDFQFRYPLLVAAWSICLYASGFTPGLYSLGSVVLARMLCTIKITFQILLLLNELYLLGWICQKRRALKKAEVQGQAWWWFYLLAAAAMLLIFVTAPNQAGCYSAYGAYYYIHTGEAYNFYQEYLARLEVLKSDEPNVIVEPYHWRPWFLCAGELSDDPGTPQNFAIARWYGKESVICQPKE